MKFFLSFLLLYSFQRTVSRLVCRVGGDEENRTPDPLLARQVLSQLSYTPMVLFFKAFSIVFSFSFAWKNVVGLTRLELVTSRLSGVRSNQLSYEPIPGGDERVRTDGLLLARQALSQLSYTPVFGCDQLSRSTLQQSEDVLTPSKPYSAFDVS